MGEKVKKELSDGKNTEKTILKRLMEFRELTIVLLIILFSVVLTMFYPGFMTVSNWRIILNGQSLIMLMASVVTISLISGHPDLSVGSILGCGAFAATLVLEAGGNAMVAFLAGALFGGFLGLINGLAIVKLGLLPFVVTLATQMAYQGLGLTMIGNRAVANLPTEFKDIVQKTEPFGIPFNIFVAIIAVIIFSILLKYNRSFHEAYFIGGNKESARLAGINVDFFVIRGYVLNGLMAGLAGVLYLSRLGGAPSTIGDGMQFDVICAMLIGGVSFSGGSGTIVGSFLGAIVMGMLTNALAFLNINTNFNRVLTGAIIIFAVFVDNLNRRRKERA